MDYDPKSDVNNMAITFGPNLMWAPLKLQSANTAVTIQKQQMVIKGLLENANDLFELSDKSRHSSRVSVYHITEVERAPLIYFQKLFYRLKLFRKLKFYT